MTVLLITTPRALPLNLQEVLLAWYLRFESYYSEVSFSCISAAVGERSFKRQSANYDDDDEVMMIIQRLSTDL